MKPMNVISLAVATALIGAAGSAAAAGGPLQDDYLFVFDPTTNASFVADIGSPYTSSPTSNISLSSFNAWASFVAGATGPSSGWDFAILGGNSGTGAGDISQAAGFPVTTGEYASTDLENIYTAVTSQAATSYGTGNSSYTNSSTALYSFLNTIYDGGAGDAGSGVGNSIYATGTGTNALNLYYQNASGTVTLLSGATLVANGLSSQVDFSTAAAVPEPETYGLMMAGLLAVGAIVRRRSRT